MTNAEHDELVDTYGAEFTKKCIETLDNYKGSSGKKYKNDYRAILSWVVGRVQQDNNRGAPKYGITKSARFSDFLEEEIDNDKEGDNSNPRDNPNVVSTILSGYTVE